MNPDDELRKLKDRFATWKKDYKSRLKETKVTFKRSVVKMRNHGKDDGGRRAPSECITYMVRSFPHICVPLHERKTSRKDRREDNFVVLSLLAGSLVRWRRRQTPSPIPERPVFWDCQKNYKGTARDL